VGAGSYCETEISKTRKGDKYGDKDKDRGSTNGSLSPVDKKAQEKSHIDSPGRGGRGGERSKERGTARSEGLMSQAVEDVGRV